MRGVKVEVWKGKLSSLEWEQINLDECNCSIFFSYLALLNSFDFTIQPKRTSLSIKLNFLLRFFLHSLYFFWCVWENLFICEWFMTNWCAFFFDLFYLLTHFFLSITANHQNDERASLAIYSSSLNIYKSWFVPHVANGWVGWKNKRKEENSSLFSAACSLWVLYNKNEIHLYLRVMYTRRKDEEEKKICKLISIFWEKRQVNEWKIFSDK